MSAALEGLRRAVMARALAPGRTDPGVPGLALFRADGPFEWRAGRAIEPFLGVVVQGRKQARVNGHTFAYGCGDAFVLTAEMAYDARVVAATPESPYLSLTLSIPSEVVVETALGLPPRRAGVPPGDAYVDRIDDRAVDAVRRLVEATDDPDERRVLVPLALREIVFHLLRSDAAVALRRAAHDDDDRRRIRQAMSFIQLHADRALKVERIAKHVGMSPSHFAHRFRAIARVTPMRYVKTVRLHRARVLLLRDGARPAEVAGEVGYGSSSHFSRDFKEYFGAPPAEYARRTRSVTPSADEPRYGFG